MNFLSLCSGIEAASVAFKGLGWKAIGFSEIEPFPCAVLAHHYPSVPNFGDMTKFREWPEDLLAQVDIVVGGPPCQAFSVAGKREGLSDARGNLTLTYVELIDHVDAIRSVRGLPRVLALYENVPGILSDSKTNAFGCLVGAIAGQHQAIETETGRWPNCGILWGQKRRVGYRILDAQFFGLAQRRRRVFLIAVPNELVESLGDRADPGEILSIPKSLRRDTAPSRETGQAIAASTGASTASRSWPADVSSTLDTTFGTKQGLEDQHVNAGYPMFVPVTAPTLRGNRPGEGGMPNDASQLIPVVANTLNTLQGIQSPDTYNYVVTPVLPFGTTQVTSALNRSSPKYGDPCHPLATGAHAPAIAFSENGDIASTLRTGGNDHADVYNSVAVAFGFNVCPDHCGGDKKGQDVAFVTLTDVARTLDCTGADVTRKQGGTGVAFTAGVDYENNGHTPDEPTGPLLKGSPTGGGRPLPAISLPNMQVRRLTPIECERLQGFPDNWTRIPYRNKPAELCPDGPRYKALGNSWAVPVVRWIGQRIQKAIQ